MVTSHHLIQIRVGKRKRKYKIIILSVKVLCADSDLHYTTLESKYIILLRVTRFIEQWEIEFST